MAKAKSPSRSGALETRWTYVILGRSSEHSRYEEAWNYLFGTYRSVIESYFRRHAPDPTMALEWADEFMAAWVEGKMDGADREKGRFRQFLFGALRKFRYKKYREISTRKAGIRGVTAAQVKELHDNIPDPSASEAEAAFEQDYAHSVLEHAIKRLSEYEDQRNSRGVRRTLYYTLINEYHILPGTGAEQPTYQTLATKHGLTEKAVERQLDHARHKLRDWILSQLRETVSNRDELQEEVYMMLRHCGGALEGFI